MEITLAISIGIVVWGAIFYPMSKRTLMSSLVLGTIFLLIGISALFEGKPWVALIPLIGAATDYYLAWKKHKSGERLKLPTMTKGKHWVWVAASYVIGFFLALGFFVFHMPFLAIVIIPIPTILTIAGVVLYLKNTSYMNKK